MKSGRMTVLAVFAQLQDRLPGESPHNLLECPEKKMQGMRNPQTFKYTCS